MSKKIFLILILLIGTKCYGQSKIESAIQKVKTFYVANAQLTSNKSPTFYFNRFSNIMNLGGADVPLLDINVEASETNNGNVVWLRCKYESDCIYNKGYGQTIGLGIPFKSKEKCYAFIELLADLKDACLK